MCIGTGAAGCLARRLQRRAQRGLRAVRLRRRGEVDRHLGERKIALRWPQHVKRVARRDGELQRFGSASPMSSAAIAIARRKIVIGSSPPSIIRAIQ